MSEMGNDFRRMRDRRSKVRSTWQECYQCGAKYPCEYENCDRCGAYNPDWKREKGSKG